jgi:hypothetical protein
MKERVPGDGGSGESSYLLLSAKTSVSGNALSVWRCGACPRCTLLREDALAVSPQMPLVVGRRFVWMS